MKGIGSQSLNVEQSHGSDQFKTPYGNCATDGGAPPQVRRITCQRNSSTSILAERLHTGYCIKLLGDSQHMSDCSFFNVCGLDDSADPESRLCILHTKKADKDKAAFGDTFRKHRADRGNDFRSFGFPAKVGFGKTIFTEDARFSGATFLGDASFHTAIFKKGADFSGATFKGEALFGEASFRGDADLEDAIFEGEALFYRTVFSAEGKAEFSKARFEKDCNFLQAHFEGKGYFNEAKFSGEAVFIDCEYVGFASFVGARFGGRATFLGTVFGDSTTFVNADFSKEAYFEGTIFKSPWINFQGANFSGRALFSGKFFNEETTEKTEAERRSQRIFQDVAVDFRTVLTHEAKSFVFRKADLQRVLFEDTDLRNVEFIDVLWPEIHGRSCVYDQEVPRNEQGDVVVGIALRAVAPKKRERTARKKNFPWGSIEKLYRDLKRHHDDRRDYQKAGDFHYGEKEMQRGNPQTKPAQRFFLRLYRLASGYGEEYLRPLLWAALVWLLSAAGYLIFGLHPKGEQTYLRISNAWDWLHSLHFSFRVMTLLKPDEYLPAGYSVGVSTLENLLGPLFLGLFALALRQRLKR
jgi:uncharacterized protein YjbI with pentapeptide repeats